MLADSAVTKWVELLHSRGGMATEDSIPVVDFREVLSCSDLSTSAVVGELHSAFTKVGFVFIRNHGIEQQLVKQEGI